VFLADHSVIGERYFRVESVSEHPLVLADQLIGNPGIADRQAGQFRHIAIAPRVQPRAPWMAASVAFLLEPPDLISLRREFGNARLDLVSAVAEPLHRRFFLDHHPRGFEIKQPHTDLVDARHVLDLDRGLALLDGDLLLKRLCVRCINRAQLGLACDSGALFLDAEHLLEVIEVPLGDLFVVSQPLAEDLRLDLQPPPRGFFFRSQVLGEILSFGLLNLLLPVRQAYLQLADDVLPCLARECDPLLVAALVGKCGPFRICLLDFGHVSSETRQPTPARFFKRPCALALYIKLLLPDLGRPLQRFEVWFTAGFDGDPRAFVGPRLLAGQQTVAGDQFADLVVGHALLAKGVNAGPAAQKLIAQRLPLHLVEAGLKLILGVLPLRVDAEARADHAHREQCVWVKARELERGDRLRERHDPVGQGVGSQHCRHPQRCLAELLE